MARASRTCPVPTATFLISSTSEALALSLSLFQDPSSFKNNRLVFEDKHPVFEH